MDPQSLQALVETTRREAVAAFQKMPGSAVIARYIQSSYQDDPVRSAIELVLFLFFVRYMMAPSYSTHRQNFVELREDEIDELVADWTPEPIVAPLTDEEREEVERLPVLAGPTGAKVKLTNGKSAINLASLNFFNLATNEHLKARAIETLRNYGVGPCGPPQFYGTHDVHVQAEANIAQFLGVEKCIVYAHAFSTISSVIPSFCKRGDVIVADAAVNVSILKGLAISRSQIRWYPHNDYEALERVLRQVAQEQAKKKVLTRRFIVTEAVFENVGDSVDLPRLVALKEKYKFRMILDETGSFGVMGRTGRGLTEAQNLDATQIDMIIGSLAGALCGGGGFCAGARDVVDHQRVTSMAYTFSAALPTMMAVTTSEVLSMLQQDGSMLATLRENIRAMRAQLDPRSDWVVCASGAEGASGYVAENPVLLLVLKREVVEARQLTVDDEERLLQEAVDEALANGVLVTRLHRGPLLKQQVLQGGGGGGGGASMTSWRPRPALKVYVTTGLSKKEIEKAGTTIRHAITKVMKR